MVWSIYTCRLNESRQTGTFSHWGHPVHMIICFDYYLLWAHPILYKGANRHHRKEAPYDYRLTTQITKRHISVDSGTPLKWTLFWPPLCVCNTEISVLLWLPVYILPLGVEMCNRAVEYKETMFSDLSIAIQYWERLVQWVIMLTWCPVFESTGGGAQSYKSSRWASGEFCTVQVLLGLRNLSTLQNTGISALQGFWLYTNICKCIQT